MDQARVLLDQYAKSGSLSEHNVVMALVGNDFRFEHPVEWDQQYVNYQNLFNYINANARLFNDSHVTFGTVSDYFDAVRQRVTQERPLPTLTGDFFPYADIFNEGRPAYWTGYYNSRPFYKVKYWLFKSELVKIWCLYVQNWLKIWILAQNLSIFVFEVLTSQPIPFPH